MTDSELPENKPVTLVRQSTGSVARYVRERRRQLVAVVEYTQQGRGVLSDVDARVDCNGCTACCWFSNIDLYPPESGDGLSFDLVDGVRRLRKNADGSCVHLINHRCSVHDQRPIACRNYDCREMAVAGIRPASSAAEQTPLTAAVARWDLKLATHDDRIVADKVNVLAAKFALAGLSAESAAQEAINHIDVPAEKHEELVSWVIADRAGRATST
jgi:hypothetical protein